MSAHLIIKIVQAPSSGAAGNEFPVDIDLTATVSELKEQVAEKSSMPQDHIRLVCAGRVWQDVATVGSYQPRDGAIVHCLNNPPRAAPSTTEQTPQAVNPMQALMGGGGGGAAFQSAPTSNDPFQQMMAQSQQMMAQNPDMMQQLMNSPMVQQMMSNPETIRAMMRMNPQMNQLMEQRPEIARLLEDPEVLQQSMQMVRNPSLMREMQRNADRAIGQLDAMPGGHSALLRAHEEMVDPLMAALTGSNEDNGPTEVPTYTQETEGGPNSQALPNPWGAPLPTAAATPAAAPQQRNEAPAAAAPAATPAAAAMPAAGLFPGAGAGGAPNPLGSMMQQMMSNPAMLQQSMQMAQMMQGGGGGFGAGAGLGGQQPMQPNIPAANPLGANPFAAMLAGANAGTPAQQPGANPMMAMMQQMMQNQALGQQSQQMAQMFGGGLGAGTATEPAAAGGQQPAAAGTTPVAGVTPQAADAMGPMMRVRFAAQLAQLSSMGFCNEAACLRALVQHQGRVDAAIDTLLSSGEGGSA